MEVQFYRNNSTDNALNKELVETVNIDLTIKDTFDISTPFFLISAIVNIADSNYCYIPSIQKYYFITAMEKINNSLNKIHLKIDVLMTYKNIILNSMGTVIETDNQNNIKPYDSDIPLLDTMQHKTLLFSGDTHFAENDCLYLVCVN